MISANGSVTGAGANGPVLSGTIEFAKHSANGSVTGAGANGPVLSGTIEFAKPRATGTKVTGIELATLRTDEAGRLLVVGGPGISGSPLNAKIDVFSDNDGWYDSVSDGPVSANLR